MPQALSATNRQQVVFLKDLSEVINGYHPKAGRGPAEVWPEIGPFVREVAGRLHNMTPATMRVYIQAIAYYAFSAYESGLPLDVEVIFTPTRVERFIETKTAHLVPSSRATRRAALAKVGREVTKKAPWVPPGREFAMSQLSPPYSNPEVEQFLQMAGQQSTPFKRRVATAQLCLGLGAGLRGNEYLSVGLADLALNGDVFVVDVPGARARKVPIHQRYADVLLGIGGEHPEEPFIAPLNSADPGDRLDRILRLPHYSKVARPTTNRLRTTWMLRMLRSGCNLSEVLYMSGLQGTKSLIDLVPYIEFRDVREWFAGAADFHD